MRYIKYFKPDHIDIIIQDIDKAIISLMNMQLITYKYLEEQKGYVFICYLENSIEISTLSKQFMDIFNMTELSAEQVIEEVQLLNPILKCILNEHGQIEQLTVDEYNTKYNIKPFIDATWDTILNVWKYVPDVLNSIDYNILSGKNDTNIYEKVILENRLLRNFYLWKVEEKSNSNSQFMDACTSTKYNLIDLEEITHSTNQFQELVISKNENNKYINIYNHVKVVDVEPLGCITYQNYSNEQIPKIMNLIHPHCCARTIHEMFRLIIEWAFAYRIFNNTEPIAELCDSILRCVQMPLEIRTKLLEEVPAQVVERFIRGDVNACLEDEQDPPMPENFKYWISDVYRNFYPAVSGLYENINVNDLPESYPM